MGEEYFSRRPAGGGDRGEHRLLATTSKLDQLRVRPHVRQVALIELNHERHLTDLEPVRLQVFAKIDECGSVVLGLGELRVGNERNTVGALEHEPARRAVDR